MDFVAYTDESYITANRYRAIACCSLSAQSESLMAADLAALLKKSGVNEFKWEKLKDAKSKFCAKKLIDYILRSIDTHKVRVDVVVWDTQDTRHQVKKRDDNANFERMFFHLLSTSMRRRPISSAWGVYPDEKNEIDWATVSDCLSAVGRWSTKNMSVFERDFINDHYFHLNELKQVQSHESPLSQIADPYAGLSVFSRDKYAKYSKWLSANSETIDMFGIEQQIFSNRERYRFEVLRYFNEACKSQRLGVSLKSKGYLHTPNPSNPINFWPYRPQHMHDKAPTKNG